jgi:WD40 repeat protein
MASESYDKTIKIWGINSLECIQTLLTHSMKYNRKISSLICLLNNRMASSYISITEIFELNNGL